MPEEIVKDWPLRGYWEATQVAVRALKETYTKLGVLPPYAVGESIDRVLSTSLDDISVPGFKVMTDQIKELEEKLHNLRTSVVGYAEELGATAQQLMHEVPSSMRPR